MFESEIDEFLRKQANEQRQPDELQQQPQQCNQQYTKQGAVKSRSPPGLVTLQFIGNLFIPVTAVSIFRLLYYNPNQNPNLNPNPNPNQNYENLKIVTTPKL